MKKQILMACIMVGAMAAATNSYAQDRKKGDHPRGEEMFKKLDTDGDGKISKAEADKAERPMLKDKFAEIDVNADGYLEKEELKAFRQQKMKDRKK